MPAKALQIFLSSSAADVDPFAPKHVLTCTLRTGQLMLMIYVSRMADIQWENKTENKFGGQQTSLRFSM